MSPYYCNHNNRPLCRQSIHFSRLPVRLQIVKLFSADNYGVKELNNSNLRNQDFQEIEIFTMVISRNDVNLSMKDGYVLLLKRN